jgi:antitoxin VapB
MERATMSGRKVCGNARPEDWAWLDALVGPLDEDFVQAMNEEPREQERPALEIFDRADLNKPRKSD